MAIYRLAGTTIQHDARSVAAAVLLLTGKDMVARWLFDMAEAIDNASRILTESQDRNARGGFFEPPPVIGMSAEQHDRLADVARALRAEAEALARWWLDKMADDGLIERFEV